MQVARTRVTENLFLASLFILDFVERASISSPIRKTTVLMTARVRSNRNLFFARLLRTKAPLLGGRHGMSGLTHFTSSSSDIFLSIFQRVVYRMPGL